MASVDPIKNKIFGILGLGRTGIITSKKLVSLGATVLAWDESETVRNSAKKQNLEVVDLSDVKNLGTCDRLLVSPGISHLYPTPNKIVQLALDASILLDNDIGLFFEYVVNHKATLGESSKPVIIGITGTNGKSTTTKLIHHTLQNSGFKSAMAGNIGEPVFSIPLSESFDCIVLELSSYQLELAKRIEPDIAVFLNINPDHLDRHAGMGGYFQAKANLFKGKNLTKAIMGTDQNEGQFLANFVRDTKPNISVTMIKKVLPAKTCDSVIINETSFQRYELGELKEAFDLKSLSHYATLHNVQNVAAAFATCSHLGISSEKFFQQLISFEGLPHRREFVAEVSGLIFINDSKATNFSSAIGSLKAFKNIHWLAGGLIKEEDFEELSLSLGNVKSAYFFGSSAEVFAKNLKHVPHCMFTTLEEAFSQAIQQAELGDTILLAPGGASFDQFLDFEQRGNRFKELALGVKKSD